MLPHPALFQLNTRVRLSALAATLGRRATLDDLPDTEIAGWAEAGFSLIWLLGVWQTGERSRQVSLTHPAWQAEHRRVLPDLSEADVCGSCFAVQAYEVHRDFGGNEALARLRARLRRHGLGLLLDFVPNHVALDHPWIDRHPEYFLAGGEAELAAHPDRYVRMPTARGPRIFALGRDPYFPGWPDTLQLNYGSAALCEAMRGELARVAALCDGVRCDMAMLLLPDVFMRTWETPMQPFWPDAIAGVRAALPTFLFVAEAYWDLEWTLQQQGFDFTYDKRLYDRLVAGAARPVREHLGADLAYQARLVRFLENHDEPRAAATFATDQHRAAAVITFFAPGMRLFYQGQREGRRARLPTHLGRAPAEAEDHALHAFYDELERCLRDAAFHDGQFQLMRAEPAWRDNPSHDAFIAFTWTGPGGARHLIAVNYAPHASQCYLPLPWGHASARVTLRDRLHAICYERDAAELAQKGLYLDLPPWGYHVFAVH